MKEGVSLLEGDGERCVMLVPGAGGQLGAVPALGTELHSRSSQSHKGPRVVNS